MNVATHTSQVKGVRKGDGKNANAKGNFDLIEYMVRKFLVSPILIELRIVIEALALTTLHCTTSRKIL